jgi:hypothetical protein
LCTLQSTLPNPSPPSPVQMTRFSVDVSAGSP